jgi:hypothetical protein
VKADFYTKAVLTVIAIMLTVIASRGLVRPALDILKNPALQIILGAVISAGVSVLVMWLSRPKVKISIDEPQCLRTKNAEGEVLEKYRAVRVVVANTKRFPRFWPRQTVIRATASITFHKDQTGKKLFDGRRMRGRWASLPQPEVVVLDNDGNRRLFPDPSLAANIPEIDIPWGEKEPLDIAVRFENEPLAYGWSNENYYDPEERYRAKQWCLRENCLVKVVVRGSGETSKGIYRLISKQAGDFRLDHASRRDRKLVRRNG